MSYAVTVDVRFDPTSLCDHNWRLQEFGLAKFIGAERCTKCGDQKFAPDMDVGCIHRAAETFWKTGSGMVPKSAL